MSVLRERLLADPEWSQWSDNKIAEICHVSNELVAKHRKSHYPISDSEKSSEPPKTRMFANKHGTISTTFVSEEYTDFSNAQKKTIQKRSIPRIRRRANAEPRHVRLNR